MKNNAKFLVGVGLSASASYVWTLIPGNETFSLSSNPVAFMEHYHTGLIALNVAKHVKKAKPYAPYLNGFGAGLIAVEAVGSQPFGYGKAPWEVVANVTVGGFLIWALML